MTTEDILTLAKHHAQYRDAQHLTLRGDAILDFARDVIAARDKEVEPAVARIEAVLDRVKEAL